MVATEIINFRSLLESYYIIKYSVDAGGEQGKINRIKMDIYNDFLNLSLETNPDIRAINSKVMKEFFHEVDKKGEEYISEEEDMTPFKIAKESTGDALYAALKFMKKFNRYQLLDESFRNILIEFQTSPITSSSSGTSTPGTSTSGTSTPGTSTSGSSTPGTSTSGTSTASKKKYKKKKSKKKKSKKRKSKKKKSKKRKSKNK